MRASVHFSTHDCQSSGLSFIEDTVYAAALEKKPFGNNNNQWRVMPFSP